MLLESLTGSLLQLHYLQEVLGPEEEVVDPQSLGRTTAGAFVVGLRSALTQPERDSAELPFVGTLHWNGKSVSLEPNKDLREHAEGKHYLLLNYLQSWREFSGTDDFLGREELETSGLWKYLSTNVPGLPSSPISSGQELIIALCSLLVRARLARDPDLASTLRYISESKDRIESALNVLATALSLLVHDAVCSGQGIRIETIGSFRPLPDLDFVADMDLISLAQAWHHSDAALH